MTDYLSGLAAMTGIPDPGNPLIERTAALIGLPVETVRRERGRVDPHTFAGELRRPEREILSVYDATVARPGTGDPRSDRAGDPVLDTSVASLTAAFQSYASGELGYRTEQPYRVLSRDVSRGWDWNAVRGEGGLGIALSSLRRHAAASATGEGVRRDRAVRSGDPLFRDALAARSALGAGGRA